MANITIPNLPQSTSLDGTELLLGVQSGTSKAITTGQIASLANGGNGVTPIPVSIGGTGNNTFDNYGVLYGDGTNPVESITPPTGSNYILVASPGTIPAWQENIPVTAGVNSISFGSTGLTPNTATEGLVTVAGTLATANGGTNLTSFTANGAVYATSTSVLTTGTLPAISGGTGQSSYTIGDLLYADTTTTLAKLADVATGSVLVSGGVAGNPSYSASPTLTTSLTTPLLIGGTTASSSLTLQSTSGVGTTDNISFFTGSQVQAMRIRTDQNVTIGSTVGSASVVLGVGKTMAGNSTSRGIEYNGSIDASVVTTNAYSFNSAPDVGAGTLNNLQHYRATQGTFTGSVTNQFGFSASSALVGATTLNVGFRGDLAAATGSWNFYGSGTANNAFVGSTRIGSLVAPTNTLDVTGTFGVSGAVTLSTPLAVSSGGTGATTANAALTNLTTFTTTATAGGTTVLTNTSTYFQFFTGTLTQTITLPVTSTLGQGWTFHIVNNGTGDLTVNSSGGNLLITVLPGTTAMATCILTSGTTAASWEAGLTDFSTATGTGSVVLATSPTLVTPALGVATATSVAIGGATIGANALAVTGTVLFNTALTVPTVYGGTGAASSLSFYSTSGAGTTDNISLYTGSQIQAMRIRTDQNITIGSTVGSNAVVVLVSKTMTGNATSRGVEYSGSIDASVVTTNAYAFNSAPDVSAGTLGTLALYRASQGTLTGTVTNQYGFVAASTLSGAASNIGFYGNVNSAANNYNFYGNSTANNLFNGYSFGLGGVMASTTSTATNTVTLTSTQIASGFIVGTPTATASYTLPLASALDTELTNAATGYNFEFVVFTTAAFAITLLTATGWTLVGSMATGATANSFARFRARKTGTATYTLYRVS